MLLIAEDQGLGQRASNAMRLRILLPILLPMLPDPLPS
jgi:hypothetical protein